MDTALPCQRGSQAIAKSDHVTYVCVCCVCVCVSKVPFFNLQDTYTIVNHEPHSDRIAQMFLCSTPPKASTSRPKHLQGNNDRQHCCDTTHSQHVQELL